MPSRKQTKPVYEPAPRIIERECAKIREDWSDQRRDYRWQDDTTKTIKFDWPVVNVDSLNSSIQEAEQGGNEI